MAIQRYWFTSVLLVLARTINAPIISCDLCLKLYLGRSSFHAEEQWEHIQTLYNSNKVKEEKSERQFSAD